MIFKRVISQFTLGLTSAVGFVCCLQAQERSWVDLAVHNFGAPINTMWAEGELSFAADGTMVSAAQDRIWPWHLEIQKIYTLLHSTLRRVVGINH